MKSDDEAPCKSKYSHEYLWRNTNIISLLVSINNNINDTIPRSSCEINFLVNQSLESRLEWFFLSSIISFQYIFKN